MTYAELRALIAQRAIRTDLGALIPSFVQRAHTVIAREVMVSADIDVESQLLPADCGEVVTVWVRGERFSYPLRLGAARVVDGGGTGRPSYYIADATGLFVGPIPDQAYRGELKYRLRPETFTADDDTNAVLTAAPDLYLYGALAELFRHTRDEARATLNETLFRDGIARFNRRSAAPGGTLQMIVAPV